MRVLTVVLSLFLLTAPAGATLFLPADLGDLSREAYAIARGRVVAVEARWTSPARRSIETIVTLEAAAWLKGDLGATVQFRVPGGRLGRYRNIVVGAPEFQAGQQVVIFLGASPPALPFVLGLGQGVFRIAAGNAGPVVTPPAVLPTAGAPKKIVRGDPARRPIPVAEFDQRVRALTQ
jgi:hypothetical protein